MFTEEELLSLGFSKNQWIDEGGNFTEHIIGNGSIGVEISGFTLVEITSGQRVFITVPNCENLEDLKCLLKLFNIS